MEKMEVEIFREKKSKKAIIHNHESQAGSSSIGLKTDAIVSFVIKTEKR